MKEITSIYAKPKNPYILLILLIVTTIIFTILGHYWNNTYYKKQTHFSSSYPYLSVAMNGIHDGLYLNTINISSKYNFINTSKSHVSAGNAFNLIFADNAQKIAPIPKDIPETSYTFTTVSDNYFNDACFIGDSRTVGISEYANIQGATFLCKTSLSIYDYSKNKIMYENKQTSIKEVLSNKQFSKIYLMVGINECGIGTPESFYKTYSEVVQNIRQIQPNALIFIQGNLLVTKQKSEEQKYITNENIHARNKLISTLANQKDIFYIDINESSLCENGALISDYTWDQVHIKAQYYEIWKNFLLNHAIIL